MKPKRWQQVEQLYHAALEREATERAAFIADSCTGDEDLRREVESLLSYDGQGESFIEAPALEVAAKMIAQKQSETTLTGQTISHYKIIRFLGVGGMGEVYLAEDTRLRRNVALKFLPTLFTQDKTVLSRFEQEARAVAALSHPNVCVIHEVVETEEGRHCLVMEYVDGETLRAEIAKQRMNVAASLDIAIQVTSALAAAHAAGIVHRDIKPENIMLRRDGYVKILDFGLAKPTGKKFESVNSEDETQVLEFQTMPGIVMGTVAYMSPEQARALPVDARTDIWSLGVVLYEMVTGRQPFIGATPTDVIISIAGREVDALSNHAPEAPIQLERIVKKALAKECHQRYQTAEEMLVDLRSLKHDLEVGAEVNRYDQSKLRKDSDVTSDERKKASSTSLPFGLTFTRIIAIGTIVAALVIAGLIYRQRSTTAPTTTINSLAVLPLENISGDTSQDYFADGMTESLITDLAKIGALRVISRPSVMQFKGSRESLKDIGRKLNVDALLIGSVVRSGERVRISVQLIDVPTERPIWTAESYDRDLRDVLVLQKEVTRDIVNQIRIKLTPQEQGILGSFKPVNPTAYDHYLRGRFYLNRQTKEDNEAAIAALEQAVAADQNFAAAYAELAQAYSWKLFLFAPEEKQWAEKAFIAAEKALTLDPDSAVAHLARGRILWTPANHFPHEKAIQEYRRAVTLNPGLDEARNQLALVYCHIGALDEAIKESQQAITTNPNNNLAQLRIGQTLNLQGKYDQALSVLEALPKEVNPALVGHGRVWALFNLGRKDEASTAVEQYLKRYPEDNGGLFTSLRAVLAAAAGQEHKAQEEINVAVEKGKGFGHFHHTAYYIACSYALMKKPEQAIKWLEAAADDGLPCYPLFKTDTNLNNLRHDSRFVTFLAKQKQQWEHYQTII